MMPGTYPSAPGSPQLVVQSSKQIWFNWQQPFDNGGSEIVEYEISITKVADNTTTVQTVINSLTFDFTPQLGLQAGNQYKFKVRAKNFYTKYYGLSS